jgi:hypothetical protein
MIDENNARVKKLEGKFEKEYPGKPGFFVQKVLICDENIPLSWSLTRRDADRMKQALLRNEGLIEEIAGLIRGDEPRATDASRN